MSCTTTGERPVDVLRDVNVASPGSETTEPVGPVVFHALFASSDGGRLGSARLLLVAWTGRVGSFDHVPEKPYFASVNGSRSLFSTPENEKRGFRRVFGGYVLFTPPPRQTAFSTSADVQEWIPKLLAN